MAQRFEKTEHHAATQSTENAASLSRQVHDMARSDRAPSAARPEQNPTQSAGRDETVKKAGLPAANNVFSPQDAAAFKKLEELVSSPQFKKEMEESSQKTLEKALEVAEKRAKRWH